MSLLLKTQTRLFKRGITGASVVTARAELLSKAALNYVDAVDKAIDKLDRFPSSFKDPAIASQILEAANKILECALTGDMIQASAMAENVSAEMKSIAADEALPRADPEKIVPFISATPPPTEQS